ncbi:MAG: rod shape-determining protein MreC [Candidatus Omnitrophota bacterium]
MAKSNKNFPLAAVFISILSIVILSQIFSKDTRVKILNVFRTPLKLISVSSCILRDVSNFKEILNENKILKENINNLENKILQFQEASIENKRLRELLGFRGPEKRRFAPAMVIARDPIGMGNTIIIDKGKQNNIHKDMVVISGGGLVGRVRECGWSIARVLLITDEDSVVGSMIQETRDEGAIVGDGYSGLLMKYLELSSEVKEGDKVVTSGFSGVFEKGILIGEITSITKDASGLYLNAIVKPEVYMMRIEDVLVIRK